MFGANVVSHFPNVTNPGANQTCQCKSTLKYAAEKGTGLLVKTEKSCQESLNLKATSTALDFSLTTKLFFHG